MYKQAKVSLQLSGVALAVMQAFAPAAVAQEQQPDSSTVVVKGIRASARSSVAIKRDTLEVVDAITAEDIGKLPDNNVAETLTRIPGVQGYRYGGELAGGDGSEDGGAAAEELDECVFAEPLLLPRCRDGDVRFDRVNGQEFGEAFRGDEYGVRRQGRRFGKRQPCCRTP